MAVVFDSLTGKTYSVPQAPDGNEMRPPARTQQAKDLDSDRTAGDAPVWAVAFEQGEGLGLVLNARA